MTANSKRKWLQKHFTHLDADLMLDWRFLVLFFINQIIFLLLTIVMCMLKDNSVNGIKRLCISFIVTISIPSGLPLLI